MFVDADIIRQVQQELDQVIEEGVNNIVDLLKNADNRPGSSSLNIEEDTLEAKRRKMKNVRNSWTHNDANLAKKDTNRSKASNTNNEDGGQGKNLDLNQKISSSTGSLTNQLLQQGIVTQKMIKQLKRELRDDDK